MASLNEDSLHASKLNDNSTYIWCFARCSKEKLDDAIVFTNVIVLGVACRSTCIFQL